MLHLDDEEQLVLVLVVVPHELALQLSHLDIEIVHLSGIGRYHGLER